MQNVCFLLSVSVLISRMFVSRTHLTFISQANFQFSKHFKLIEQTTVIYATEWTIFYFHQQINIRIFSFPHKHIHTHTHIRTHFIVIIYVRIECYFIWLRGVKVCYSFSANLVFYTCTYSYWCDCTNIYTIRRLFQLLPTAGLFEPHVWLNLIEITIFFSARSNVFPPLSNHSAILNILFGHRLQGDSFWGEIDI